MKYFSEILKKAFDTEEECVSAEKAEEERVSTLQCRKDEKSKEVESAMQQVKAARKAVKVAQEEATKILEESNKQAEEVLDNADKALKEARDAYHKVLDEYVDEFGTYTYKSGDGNTNVSYSKKTDSRNASIDDFFDMFRKYFF